MAKITSCSKSAIRLVKHGANMLHIVAEFWPNHVAACLPAAIARGVPYVRTKGEDGFTPIHSAACNKHPAEAVEGIKFFLKVFGSSEARRTSLKNDVQPLHMLCARTDAFDVLDGIKALLAAGADPNARSSFLWGGTLISQMTALHTLAHHGGPGSPEVFEVLLAAGSDIAAKDSNGAQVLHYAARCSNQAAIETLLAAGADHTAVDNYGMAPLHHACVCATTAGPFRALLNAGTSMALGVGATRVFRILSRILTL